MEAVFVPDFYRQQRRMENLGRRPAWLLPFFVLPIYVVTVQMVWRLRRSLAWWRGLNELCTAACPTGECAVRLVKPLREFREGLLRLASGCQKVLFLRPLSAVYAREASEVEDVLEDMAISGDPEIRGLVERIAKSL